MLYSPTPRQPTTDLPFLKLVGPGSKGTGDAFQVQVTRPQGVLRQAAQARSGSESRTESPPAMRDGWRSMSGAEGNGFSETDTDHDHDKLREESMHHHETLPPLPPFSSSPPTSGQSSPLSIPHNSPKLKKKRKSDVVAAYETILDFSDTSSSSGFPISSSTSTFSNLDSHSALNPQSTSSTALKLNLKPDSSFTLPSTSTSTAARDVKRPRNGNSNASAGPATAIAAPPTVPGKRGPGRPRKRKNIVASAKGAGSSTSLGVSGLVGPGQSGNLNAGSSLGAGLSVGTGVRTASSSRATSRSRNLAPSPSPIYRSSRSRSTSMFPGLDATTPVRREWRTTEDGCPGEKHLSSEMVVKSLMKSYKAYFRNPRDENDKSFDPHPTNYPVAELEYPNSNAVERFILLAPKDKDHYNPILDLETSLYTIIEYYCTPEQRALFGPLPDDALSDDTSPPPSPSPSPPPTNTGSRSSSSRSRSRSLDIDAEFELAASASSSHPSSSGPSTASSSSSAPPRPQIPLARMLRRALYLQDGPLFQKAMSQINDLLRSFKYPPLPCDPMLTPEPNTLMRAPDTWTNTGIPKKVLMRIVEENYQRACGPNVPKLKRYEAFSSTVYGELMPSLVDEITRITGLKEDSLFLDLGSGVGNVVVQASLQTGCRSFGIELMKTPAGVAEDMVEQMSIRCRMWGVRVGEMELECGDMLKSERVDRLMGSADVVLVDNKVFEEKLNEALRPKFLDLKEGAIVISLAPFVNSLNARMTERNVDDISAIFDVTERQYHSGDVSWGNSGGSYYLHRVDRAGYAEIRQKFENSRAAMVRGSRRR